MTPPVTHECPQKNSAHSIQQFGRLYATYIYTNVLFYYTDIVFFIGKLNYMATKETSFNVKKAKLFAYTVLLSLKFEPLRV